MPRSTAWSASTTPAAHPTNTPPTSPVPAGSDGPLPSRNTRSTSSNTTGSRPPIGPTAISPSRGLHPPLPSAKMPWPPRDRHDTSCPAPSPRKFSNHSRNTRNPARSRSVRPRNSDRSFLQHQRVFNAFIATQKRNPSGHVNSKVFAWTAFTRIPCSETSSQPTTPRPEAPFSPPSGPPQTPDPASFPRDISNGRSGRGVPPVPTQYTHVLQKKPCQISAL